MKMGVFVMGVDVFEKLVVEGYDFLCMIFDWCQFLKFKSIYIDVLVEVINFDIGCIYMFYFLVVIIIGCFLLNDFNL